MLLKSTFLVSLILRLVSSQKPTFHPSAYKHSFAKCDALNRRSQEAKVIDIAYVEVSPHAKSTLLLVHGWPSLWSSWSNQILEFQDYHLLVPDLRGFGQSQHPGDVQSSGTHGDLVGDLVCVLQHAGVTRAICVGHDWGAQLCYEAARMRPDLFDGVIGSVVPYIPSAGPFMATEQLIEHLPHLSYQVYFEKETTKALAELNQDIRQSLRSVYRTIESSPPVEFLTSTTSFLDAYTDEIPPSAFFSREEEDYIVEQYSRQGFDHTLQFYTYENRFASHAFSNGQHNFTIRQPVLAIYPTEDPVANWLVVAGLLHSADFLPNLKVDLVRAQHWPQLESPDEYNKLVRNWLTDLESKQSEKRLVDEL